MGKFRCNMHYNENIKEVRNLSSEVVRIQGFKPPNSSDKKGT